LIPEFDDAGVEVDEAPEAVSLRWQANGLILEQRSFVQANVLSHTIVLTQSDGAASTVLHALEDETRSRITQTSPKEPRFCWHGVGRWAWLPAFVAALLGLGQLTQAVAGGTASMIVVLAGLAGGVYYLLFGDRARLRRRLRNSWSLVLKQGDSDGTIRRALHSIGISMEDTQSARSP
jgi:hypothetical protein